MVGGVVSRQPGHDALNSFRRLLADFQGAGELLGLLGDGAPVGEGAFDLLGGERPAAALQLDRAALVLGRCLYRQLPLAVLDEYVTVEEEVLVDK